MQIYKNLNRISGVDRFELKDSAILVCFAKSADVYEYSYASAGVEKIETMKKLAVAGRGLNTFINKHAKHSYLR